MILILFLWIGLWRTEKLCIFLLIWVQAFYCIHYVLVLQIFTCIASLLTLCYHSFIFVFSRWGYFCNQIFFLLLRIVTQNYFLMLVCCNIIEAYCNTFCIAAIYCIENLFMMNTCLRWTPIYEGHTSIRPHFVNSSY